MVMKKRVFIAFAAEDKWARDYLIGQAKNERSPFEFVDMSVKEPYLERWKSQCRTRIKGCHGAIVLVSRNTRNADGQLWEVNCCKQERVPMRGIFTSSENRPAILPSALSGVGVVSWTWPNVKAFIDRL